MFDFFLCLFFIPYYIYKYITDRAKSDKADALYNAFSSKRDNWRKAVTDIELENSLIKEIDEHYYDDTLNKEFEEVIREVPGILDIIKVDEPATPLMRMGRKYALIVMMANRGKVINDMAVFGMIGYKKQYKGVGVTENEVKMMPYLMNWINNKLNEHGIKERLVLTQGFNDVYIVDDLEKCIKLNGGTYKWEIDVLPHKMANAKLASEVQN